MKTIEIMTPQHERWEEFCSRLSGPEGCDFREDPVRGWVWNCAGGTNRPFAAAVLRGMGLADGAILATLDYFDRHGGFCDCEILFNVDRPGEDLDA